MLKTPPSAATSHSPGTELAPAGREPEVLSAAGATVAVKPSVAPRSARARRGSMRRVDADVNSA